MRSSSTKLGYYGLAMLMASVLLVLFCPGSNGKLLGILAFALAEIGLILTLSGCIVDGIACPSNMKEIKRSEDPVGFYVFISVIFIVGHILIFFISLAGPFRGKPTFKNPEMTEGKVINHNTVDLHVIPKNDKGEENFDINQKPDH